MTLDLRPTRCVLITFVVALGSVQGESRQGDLAARLKRDTMAIPNNDGMAYQTDSQGSWLSGDFGDFPGDARISELGHGILDPSTNQDFASAADLQPVHILAKREVVNEKRSPSFGHSFVGKRSPRFGHSFVGKRALKFDQNFAGQQDDEDPESSLFQDDLENEAVADEFLRQNEYEFDDDDSDEGGEILEKRQQRKNQNPLNLLGKRPSFSHSFVGKRAPGFGHSFVGKRAPGFGHSFVGKRAPGFGHSFVGKRAARFGHSFVGKRAPKFGHSFVGKRGPRFGHSFVGKRALGFGHSFVGKRALAFGHSFVGKRRPAFGHSFVGKRPGFSHSFVGKREDDTAATSLFSEDDINEALREASLPQLAEKNRNISSSLKDDTSKINDELYQDETAKIFEIIDKNQPIFSDDILGKRSPRFGHSFVGKRAPGFGHSFVGKRAPGFGHSFVGKRAPKFGHSFVGKRAPRFGHSFVGKREDDVDDELSLADNLESDESNGILKLVAAGDEAVMREQDKSLRQADINKASVI